MLPEIAVTPGAALLFAAFLLLADWPTVAAVLAAVLLHEAGHVTALYLLRAPPRRVTFQATGACISCDRLLTYSGEIAAALAGPLANLFCAALIAAAVRLSGARQFSVYAGAHVLYFLLNMVPAGFLDGGRALSAALSAAFGPDAAVRVLYVTDLICAAVLSLLGLYIFDKTNGNFTLILCAGFLVAKTRKLG